MTQKDTDLLRLYGLDIFSKTLMEDPNQTRLYDVFMTDVCPIGATVNVSLPPRCLGYTGTRYLCQGTVIYKKTIIPALFRKFFSGNVEIVTVDKELGADFIADVYVMQKKRSFVLALRRLVKYVNLMLTPFLCVVGVGCLFSGKLSSFFLAFFMLWSCRFIYVKSRNRWR